MSTAGAAIGGDWGGRHGRHDCGDRGPRVCLAGTAARSVRHLLRVDGDRRLRVGGGRACAAAGAGLGRLPAGQPHRGHPGPLPAVLVPDAGKPRPLGLRPARGPHRLDLWRGVLGRPAGDRSRAGDPRPVGHRGWQRWSRRGQLRRPQHGGELLRAVDLRCVGFGVTGEPMVASSNRGLAAERDGDDGLQRSVPQSRYRSCVRNPRHHPQAPWRHRPGDRAVLRAHDRRCGRQLRRLRSDPGSCAN